jgi:multidrug efflux pump subunit AcrB
MRHKVVTFGAAALLFAASLWVGRTLGQEFIPVDDRGEVIVNVEFPSGSSLATTSERSAEAERAVLDLPGVTAVYVVVGPQEDVRKARWRVKLVDKNERSWPLADYKQRIREILSGVQGAQFAVSDPPVIEGIGDWPPIYMQIIGRDFAVLSAEAEFMAKTLREIPGTSDVQVRDSPGKPELAVDVDHEVAARHGLPAGAVAMQVRLATYGEVAGKMREGRREAEIRVRLAEEDRGSAEALEKLWIMTVKGPVALGQLARVSPTVGPAVIEHEQRERQITVSSQIAAGHSLGAVVTQLKQRLADHPLPQGYSYFWNGMQREMADMTNSMAMALGLALIFIFIVLASQFESLVHPFTIMLSLPLALVGAIFALALTGNALNLSSEIGVILLMGLVTKNAILLVDGALQHIREGDDPAVAMGKAGPRRLRPILMTSAAMVLGMLPTAIGTGTGSEFRSPMAVVVIGGVLTSTLLTLWVVPVVFLWVERARSALWGKQRHVLDVTRD